MKASESIQTVLCWHCEEPVHPYATRCPYCQKALSSSAPLSHSLPQSQIVPPSQASLEEEPPKKIEQIHSFTPKKVHPSEMHSLEREYESVRKSQAANQALRQRAEKSSQPNSNLGQAGETNNQDESFVSQVGHVLLALFTLLSGSFFFFFGLLILLFSQKGTFTLEWQATSWPYFVLSALILLATGLWSLSRVEK